MDLPDVSAAVRRVGNDLDLIIPGGMAFRSLDLHNESIYVAILRAVVE